ncbi:MAG: glycosyltransferase family 4 protein [Planctomycetota bacterium]
MAISVLGRFRAYDLARELDRHGALETLITSQPAALVARCGLDPRRVVGLPRFEFARRLLARAPGGQRQVPRLQRAYDNAAARHLPADADLCVGWSGGCLQTLQRARKRGARTVVERGSTHIEAQSELLQEEYARFGLHARLAERGTVERELREYELADVIAVPSVFAAESFLERGFERSRLLINPAGTDLSRFSPGPRPADGDTARPLRILFVGRVGIRKGAHRLIEAFTALERDDVELRLVGPIEPELLNVRSSLRDPRVVFEGPVPQARLVEHFRAADLFCLPSLEEGLAMVVFQAMACGLPCLVTPNTGAAGLVREGVEGSLVSAGSTEALADALERLLADPLALAGRGRAARERVETGFAWSDYGQRSIEAYTALLEGRPLPPSPLEDFPAAAATREAV